MTSVQSRPAGAWETSRKKGLYRRLTLRRAERPGLSEPVGGSARRRRWGFYLPSGYLPEAEYDATVRAGRRDLWSDQASEGRPW